MNSKKKKKHDVGPDLPEQEFEIAEGRSKVRRTYRRSTGGAPIPETNILIREPGYSVFLVFGHWPKGVCALMVRAYNAGFDKGFGEGREWVRGKMREALQGDKGTIGRDS